MAIGKEQLIDMYRSMVRIRIFEERVQKEFAAGNIPGFIHLYSGQEAVAVGICANLRPDDYITSTHRGHGHLIAKGGNTKLMMAELYGKRTGYNKGKGGSMHIADIDIGILGANGIVGGGITIASGAALSAKLRESGQIVVCFLGDGASNTSRFHEGVNMAACWDLPIVYAIENNLYAEASRTSNFCKLADLADRASGYGIPGISVDGNDVLAVYEVAAEALARARSGKGPSLLECKTYRWHGHYSGDNLAYRTNEEVEEWKKKDPIPRFEKQLLKDSVFTQNEADTIKSEAEQELEKAIEFAEQSPFPAIEEVLTGVYA